MDEIFKSKVFWFFVGAAFTFLASLIKSYFERVNENKKLFLENVTTERSKWRDSLRDDISEYCSIVYKVEYDTQFQDKALVEKAFSNKMERLNELRVKVRLKLNPRETANKPDAKIVRSMSKILNSLSIGEFSCISRELIRVERSAQQILKSEWDKSKDEVISGKLRIPNEKG